MLVSPTEQKLRSLGKSSSLPEKYGSDFLFPSVNGLVGVQRKELKDLVASLHDGRFAKELGQMGSLSLGIVLIEGEIRWTRDGQLMGMRGEFTRAQLYGVLFSTMASGLWVIQTHSLEETGIILPLIEKWLQKKRHGTLSNRPNAKGEWGSVTSREWGVHFLQGFQGIGAEVAGRIWDHFGGVPVAWNVGREELERVKGVGKGRSEVMYRALGQETK